PETRLVCFTRLGVQSIHQRRIAGVERACLFFFFSSRRRHTRSKRDWSSDVCSSDLLLAPVMALPRRPLSSSESTASCSMRFSLRSEERRVGKECRSRWGAAAYKEKKNGYM